MKKLLMFCFLATLGLGATAQQNNKADEDAVKATINNLFDGMRKADTALAASAFMPKAIMQTITRSPAGTVSARTDDPAKFVASLAGDHPVYDERIKFSAVHIDGDLASVWTDYKFYLGDKFSHCGVNSFQLLRTEKGWKINYLIDTRRKDKCNF